jgi:branched-chain amino acid transport system permease protein
VSIYVQSAISGLLAGGIFAMMAIGLSLVWGMLKVVNIAHFGLILLGGYLTYQLAIATTLDPFLTLFVTVPSFFVVGVAMQWLFERFDVRQFNSLLLSFGLFIIVIRIITNIWSADFRRLPAVDNPYATQSVILGDFAFQLPMLLAFVAAILISVAVAVVLRRTYFGKALRAIGHDPQVAAAFGIDARRMGLLLGGFASATGALAGTFVGISSALFPGSAVEWIGLVFTIVIVGGVGNLLGAMVAALLVGTVGGLASATWGASAAPIVTFVILIVALLFRPYGLFNREAAT